MRKILFLDIDGVMNPKWWNSNKPFDRYGCLFDPKTVIHLKKIISETGADIVISSSWKDMGLSELQNMWKERELPGRIIDITPDYMNDDLLLKADPTSIDYLYNRGCEIKGWLLLHGDDVSKYAIIDDMDDILPDQQLYFIQTNPDVGLTKFDAENIIRILNS